MRIMEQEKKRIVPGPTHKKKKKMRVAGEQWLNTVCSTEEGSDNRSVLHGNVTALCTLS